MTQLTFAIEYAWSFVGVPYEWGGDNPQGLDCSGFIGVILRGVGLMGNKEDLNASGIYKKFEDLSTDDPAMGCLVFYGADLDHITHIGFMVTDHYILEAGGGNSKTIDAQSADKANAFVRARPYDYRNPVAFVNPFSLEA